MEDGQTVVVGHYLFQTHRHDMQFGHRRTHVGIALIGANHHVARLCHTEVASSHARLGQHELIAQVIASAAGEVRRVVIAYLLADAPFLELLADGVARDMQRWHDDMRGFLVHQLYDTFAEVGLHHIDTVFLEIRVHLALLGEHALALDHLLHVVVFEDFEDYLVELLGILGPMDMHPPFLQVFGEHVEVVGQVGHGVHLDAAGQFAQVLPLGQTFRHDITFGAHAPECLVVPRYLFHVLEELVASFRMYCTHSPADRISTT